MEVQSSDWSRVMVGFADYEENVAVATHNAHSLGASVVREYLGAVRGGERGVDE